MSWKSIGSPLPGLRNVGLGPWSLFIVAAGPILRRVFKASVLGQHHGAPHFYVHWSESLQFFAPYPESRGYVDIYMQLRSGA